MEGTGIDLLISLVAAGDRDAFARLVHQTRDGLYRYLRGLTGSAEAAEDALQESFVALWRGARQWRGDAGRAWIYGIARRQAARTWRRRVGEPRDTASIDDLAVAAGFASGADPEQIAIAAADRDRLYAALDRLSDEDREVIMLRDLEGFTGPEAAQMLEIDLAAEKSRLHRARLRLIAALRGGCDAS